MTLVPLATAHLPFFLCATEGKPVSISIVRGFPLRAGVGEPDKAPDQVTKIAFGVSGTSEIPSCIGAERGAERDRAHTVDLIAVRVHLRHTHGIT